jgi:3-dehydroquinate synthase
MKTLTLAAGTGTTELLFGERLRALDRLASGTKRFAITDATVRGLYGDRLEGFQILEMGQGEANKTLATVERLYHDLLEAGADRDSFVVGVGGGIVCDVAGFVASTYLRGLRFGFAPTTLLAQVDASVGGKNGVNLERYKNLVGSFNQPRFVLLDYEVLRTLPARELRCGMAEVVKAAAIADPELFEFLEDSAERVMALEPQAIARAVEGAVRVKAGVVTRDEKESGERMLLNFGHTFGHAIEKTLGLPHGEAVSLGMVLACDLAVAQGVLSRDAASRVERLLERIGLPTRTKLDPEAIAEAITKDKKRTGAQIKAILLERIGRAAIHPVSLSTLDPSHPPALRTGQGPGEGVLR